MSILIGILYAVEVCVCLLLAGIVMLQKPKEGGLGGVIGGYKVSLKRAGDFRLFDYQLH